MFTNKKLYGLFIVLLISTFGCFKDLDTLVLDEDEITSETVFDDPASYLQALAKVYANLAVTGQVGPAGDADISSIDEGFSQYMRQYWYMQELTTDEAIVGWNDNTIKDFHDQDWTASDGFIYAGYYRIFYGITLANQFLKETTEEKLDFRNVDATTRADIQLYRAEARFLRALSYWHALDLFRNVPFADDDFVIGGDLPLQTDALSLFSFIESELLDIETKLGAPRFAYARADQGAAQMLLAKLYLNAEVYIGQNRFDDCLTYCEKVMDAGYTLEEEYNHLFLADNDDSEEIIFRVAYDGVHTKTYGGTTFIVSASLDNAMGPLNYGVKEGWAGLRTTKEMVGKFPSDFTGIQVDFNEGTAHPAFYLPNTTQDFDENDTDTKITAPNGDKVYEGYRYFTAGDEFYFLRFPASGLKFGDNDGDGTLENGGANIPIPETGLYHIIMDFDAKTYSIEKQDITIQGSATGGVAIPLEWDNDNRYLTAGLPLAIGDFKFFINGDDSQFFGDAAGDGLLQLGAAAVPITEEGGYEVNLDLWSPDYTYQVKLTSFDRRGNFYSDGHTLEINNIPTFTDGYAVTKFQNITSTGAPGSDNEFVDTDFPVFRLADAYLMAAEAILRNNGDKNTALTYFNTVRERAYKGTSGNILLADLNLQMLLDERARELYWECHRRTDLVRFGQFTDGDYLWAWKGGVKEGQKVEAFRDIFPIPSRDLNANINLKQNDGY